MAIHTLYIIIFSFTLQFHTLLLCKDTYCTTKVNSAWSHGSLILIQTLCPESWNSNSSVGWGSCSQGIHFESWRGYYVRPHWNIFFPHHLLLTTTHSTILFLFGAVEQDRIEVSQCENHGLWLTTVLLWYIIIYALLYRSKCVPAQEQTAHV